MNEHRTMFRKKWKALCLLPFIGLLAGCYPWSDPIWGLNDEPNNSRYLKYLPYETHIGANKFGCYVDGKVAASQGVFQKSFNQGEYVMGVFARTRETLTFTFDTKHATFFFDNTSAPFVGTNSFRIRVAMKQEDASGIAENASVEITCFDEALGIASGRFGPVDVPLYDADGNFLRTVCLTDGLFDVQMYYQW